ncbi:MAG: permease, partial [bacterium]|nr:permease [bacterium]
AAAFLYAGPALNILAVFLTARVLGFELGLWRAIGAVVFGIIVGVLMALVFRKDEERREAAAMQLPDSPPSRRKLWQTGLYFAAMLLFLVFSDWYNPGNVVVHKRDGAALQVVTLQETHDALVFQVEQPTGSLRVGDKITLAKTEIASIEEARTWVMRVYRAKWLLA